MPNTTRSIVSNSKRRSGNCGAAIANCSDRSDRNISQTVERGMRAMPQHRLRRLFWKRKLEDLNPAEWDALCDGCGKCCVRRYEGQQQGVVWVSDVSCPALCPKTASCKAWAGGMEAKLAANPECQQLTPAMIGTWLPVTCAYRLVQEGRPLFFWHHLLNGGDRGEVHRVGVGVAGRTIPARRGLDPEDRIVEIRQGETW